MHGLFSPLHWSHYHLMTPRTPPHLPFMTIPPSRRFPIFILLSTFRHFRKSPTITLTFRSIAGHAARWMKSHMIETDIIKANSLASDDLEHEYVRLNPGAAPSRCRRPYIRADERPTSSGHEKPRMYVPQVPQSNLPLLIR